MIRQIRIIPWFTCNIICHYCFYQNIKKDSVLTPPVFKRVLSSSQVKLAPSINIHFSGGEPLLAPKKINDLLKVARTLCDISCVSFVTNGTIPISSFTDVVYSHCKKIFGLITIDSWGESRYRFLDGIPIVGEKIIKSIPKTKCYELGVAMPFLPELEFDEFRKITSAAMEKNIYYFELNLVKGMRYKCLTKVKSLLRKILEYHSKNKKFRLAGDWLIYSRKGYLPCKRAGATYGQSIVILPDGSINRCELDVIGRHKIKGERIKRCIYAHDQISNVALSEI